jgi:uncharacterized membrane protein/Mg-chelatase subunit ChlD
MRDPYKPYVKSHYMMAGFSQPLWLLAIPMAIWLLIRFRKKSFAAAGRRKQNFWLAIRIVIVVFILCALAGFQLQTQVRRNQMLFLVDASDSIAPVQKEESIRFLNEALKKIKPPDQAGIIIFGSDAEVERFPSLSRSFSKFESQVDGSATNLENALRLADAVLADNYQKNVVILSDGLENQGNAQNLAKSLLQKGITLQGYYLHPTDIVEASIETVRVPPEIHLKEPFSLEVVTRSNRKMNGSMQIFRNGELIQEGNISLDNTEKNFIRIPQKITEPGIYRYDVRINPQQDFRIENNSQQAWVSVSGPPRLLLVDEHPEELKLLADAFRRRGFTVDVKQSRYFPLTLQDLLLYQAILVRNVASSEIHSQMPLIEQYVHEFGGGFAMLGGKKSFGPGGYYHTPVENVLPVRMDLVNKKYLADVAMVIVIDKSGSMSYTDKGRQKIDLADEGGARVATLLKESDRLGVLPVDSVPKWAFPIQRLGNKKDAIDAITSIRAGGGGIYVYSGLREAYREMQNIKASVKHVILFADTADCEEKDGANGESSLLLAQRAFESSEITTTTIGIGQRGDPDVEFLQQLATIASGRFYFTNDMFTLPEIFAQESAVVQRYYITEETFQPRIGQVEPLLSGLSGFPELHGYVATSAKPLANVSLTSHREDPVLAFWRHGLGQSVAYTSDPVGPWGESWLKWSDWESFWSQTARYLARTDEPAHFQVSFASNGNSTTVLVDTLDDPEQEEGSKFQGTLIDSNGNQHTISFQRSASGRYEAIAPLSGNLFGKVFRLREGDIQEAAIVQYSTPGGRESDLSANGRERLAQLTGRLVNSANELRTNSKTASDVQPIRKQLLLWALWLFLFDIAVRKIDLGIFRRRRLPQTVAPVTPVPLQKLKLRKLEVVKTRPVWIEIENAAVNDSIQQELSTPELEQPTAKKSGYMERLKEAKKRR